MEIKTDALLLRSSDYKENDLIITLFSLEKGKIAASVRGVKKAGAKLKFAAQPFCFAEYMLAEKNDRHTVVSAHLNDSFYELRNSLVKFYSACAAVEFCEKILPENSPSPEFFFLTINTVKDLCYSDKNETGILIKYLVSSLSLAGYALNFVKCLNCGEEIDIENAFFDFDKGSVTCFECRKGRRVSPNTLKVIEKSLNDCYFEELCDKDGEKRALNLLKTYIYEKTGVEITVLSDLLAL